jgi:sulfotransferase family protein
MKILGTGLSRTGTMSLTLALRRLGFRAMHYDRVRLNDILDGSNPNPDFRRYDDVDAVLDIPSAYFYRELLEAYPDAKAILTVRDVESWWKSVERHVNVHFPYKPPRLFGYDHRRRALGSSPLDDPGADNHFKMLLLNCVYGSTIALEYPYKKKYLEHNERVQREVPADRLLVMDVTAGDGWDKLCAFLGMPVPDLPFPHRHEGESMVRRKT